MLVVHSTHEAARKYGGIGAVLAGLVPCPAVRRRFPDHLLVGPLFDRSGGLNDRLEDHGQVIYSSLDGFDPQGWGERLGPLEAGFGVHLVLGRRRLQDDLRPDLSVSAEVVLVDVRDMRQEKINQFKYFLWEHFGLKSRSYPDWDLEQYLRLGAVYLEVLEALHGSRPALHLGHEYMGVPSLLSVIMARRQGRRSGDKTFFYAHEVAPARFIVENLPGHEIDFDNRLRLGLSAGRSLEEDFGSQGGGYRAELVRRAGLADGILAVSDNVRDQLLYFLPGLPAGKIKVVYNGVSFKPVNLAQKRRGRRLIQDYCENLFNFRPDFIFSHVSRLVVSKAFWRDLLLLAHLDPLLARDGLKGFYVAVATHVASGRPPEEVLRMEAEYGWPVLHRPGWPDLVDLEGEVYEALCLFNARSRAIKGVLVNQFGFSPERCGRRVPAGADALALRLSADLELGLSAYEPFGISQLETYPYGGLPCLSRACGCSHLAQKVLPPETFCLVDFSRPPGRPPESLIRLDRAERFGLEEALLAQAAPGVYRAMAETSREDRFRRMRKAAPALSWDRIGDLVAAALAGWAG